MDSKMSSIVAEGISTFRQVNRDCSNLPGRRPVSYRVRGGTLNACYMPRVSGRSRTATAGSPSKLLCGFLWRTHRAEQRRTIFLEATAEVGSCQGGSGSQLLRPVRGHAWLACAALFVMTSILHVPSPTMSGDVRGPSPVWGPVWGLGSKVARKAWFDSWSGIGLWLEGAQPLFCRCSFQDAFT